MKPLALFVALVFVFLGTNLAYGWEGEGLAETDVQTTCRGLTRLAVLQSTPMPKIRPVGSPTLQAMQHYSR